MREFGKGVLVVVLVMSMIYSMTLVAWTLHEIGSLQGRMTPFTGKATGEIRMCINDPPNITAGTCGFDYNLTFNVTLDQDEPYSCTINATDGDGTNATFLAGALSINRLYSNDTSLPFNMTSSGYIVFNTTSENVGTYWVELIANDGSTCSNRETETQLFINISDINDPPYLITDIPDQTFYEGETVHAFYLNNYFADPDDDPLNYTVSGNSSITVSINSVTSEVVISSETCGVSEYVMFMAMDPYNLTADSNLVEISCVETTSPEDTAGSGDGSGGSGGGTASVCPDPEYECYTYHQCNISNQRLVRCVDINGCEKDHFLTMPCVYTPPRECNESWKCADWEACTPNGTQTRSCTDVSNCGTNLSRPAEMQECEYVGTCSDGIKNCHDDACEEGIDCGGPCDSCQSVQVPYPFAEERGIGVYLMTGFLLFLLTGSLGYHYFRKEINQTLAKFGWFLMRKRRKQYLLSKEDQKKLMADIIPLQKRLEGEKPGMPLYELLNKYDRLLRYYLSKVVKIPEEMDSDGLEKGLLKAKGRIIPVLRSVFRSMYGCYKRVSSDERLITKTRLILLFEELRNIILQTSQTSLGEYPRDVQEFRAKPEDSAVDKALIRMINTYIALEFVEADVAKKKYLDLIKEYDLMSIADEEEVFADIQRLYNNVSYVNGWAWTVKRK